MPSNFKPSHSPATLACGLSAEEGLGPKLEGINLHITFEVMVLCKKIYLDQTLVVIASNAASCKLQPKTPPKYHQNTTRVSVEEHGTINPMGEPEAKC